MKRWILTTLALALMAAPAAATHWESFGGTADCDGWSMSGEIRIGSSLIPGFDVNYFVTATVGGVVVEEQSGTFFAPFDPLMTVVSAGGPWMNEFCGDVVVAGVFTMAADVPDNSREFGAAFLCDCGGGGDVCARTPGYWKNHEEVWPVTDFAIGGVEYTQSELLEILRRPVRGDATVILAHHLIAAKLNVWNGADDSIQGRIDDADAYLVGQPLGSRPGGAAKSEGLAIKDDLVVYNEDPDCHDVSSNKAAFEIEKSANNEDITWGALKANYR